MSQIPCTSLDELYKFEEHLESGFIALLNNVGIFNAYAERCPDDLTTPYVTVKATSGGVEVTGHRHVHIFPDGSQTWDAYQGTLETEVVTNRLDDKTNYHHLALGKMRRALQLFILQQTWFNYQQVILITDIREQGTIHTWVDDDNLDHTTLSWFLVFNINPAAWPSNVGELT